jgi:ABC-2 type transport system ATP-binding protein
LNAARTELASIKNKYIVTGMLAIGNTCNVRIVSEQTPDLKADPCDPNVEDAYMLCLHRNGVEKHILGGE